MFKFLDRIFHLEYWKEQVEGDLGVNHGAAMTNAGAACEAVHRWKTVDVWTRLKNLENAVGITYQEQYYINHRGELHFLSPKPIKITPKLKKLYKEYVKQQTTRTDIICPLALDFQSWFLMVQPLTPPEISTQAYQIGRRMLK